MKLVPLTDEQYQYLVGLGIIKEEEQAIESAYNPWEKYPTLASCWERGESRLNIDQDGKIFDSYGEYNYSTEAEAKRARATIKLSRIARKWNEGVEKKEEIYFVSISNGNDFYVDIWDADGSVSKMIPFYFYTKELLEKSLELFEQDWKDFYGK